MSERRRTIAELIAVTEAVVQRETGDIARTAIKRVKEAG
jgi:hypothetical protein